MSRLNETGEFSTERMDELAREIVYLKKRMDFLERQLTDKDREIYRLEQRIR
jgi:hypothetical protein